MAGLEMLVDKILLNAKEKAREIITAGEAEAAEIMEQCAQKAELAKAAALSRAALEAADEKTRLTAAAELAVRDKKLAAKQQLIENVLAAAVKRLAAMTGAEYTAFLASKLKHMVFSEDTEIIVPQRYRDLLDLNAVNPGLRLSQSDMRIDTGFVLVSLSSESNNTFESLIGQRRGELEKMIAEMLF